MNENFTISKENINIAQTLACGQIFSYMQKDNEYIIFSKDKIAKVVERKYDYIVHTPFESLDYFRNFFDLDRNYQEIKTKLSEGKIMQSAVEFGSGIRLLKQDLLEVIISFVFSANNNIPRITNSLFKLRERFGEKRDSFGFEIPCTYGTVPMERKKLSNHKLSILEKRNKKVVLPSGETVQTSTKEYYAFPTLNQLCKISEEEFREIGAGYRAPQLVRLIKELSKTNFELWGKLPTDELRKKLIDLHGIGPKVADCILLFGYYKTDVFPVDTWIEKVYVEHFSQMLGVRKNRFEIRNILTEKFGDLAGFAQQYLFYYQRSFRGR